MFDFKTASPFAGLPRHCYAVSRNDEKTISQGDINGNILPKGIFLKLPSGEYTIQIIATEHGDFAVHDVLEDSILINIESREVL